MMAFAMGVRVRALLAAAAGLAHALAIAWPGGGQALWWLQLASVAVLAALTLQGMQQHLPGRRAFAHGALLGAAFATAWLACTFWWLFISMHRYGGLPAPLAAAAVLALAASLALYYALSLGLLLAWAPRPPWARALMFAAVFLLAELARGQWFTGFPWGSAGYAHVDGPLAGYAPWVGAYGMAAIAAWLGCSAAQWRSSGNGLRLSALLVLALPTLVGLVLPKDGAYTRSSADISVALLQGNIAQDEKFQAATGLHTAIAWYGEQLRHPRASLTVAPETALPLLPEQLPPDLWAAIQRPFAQGGHAALIGMPLGERINGYTNAALGWVPGMATYRYDKHHLVPFGEFIPPMFAWFVRMMNIPLGNFARGGPDQSPMHWQGQRLGPNICYEDLFGEELARRFAHTATAPTILVNMSNIAWFGNTIAIDQHLHISRMRALELQRPMIRATNTGATVIIDHLGQVTHALPRHTRGVLLGTVQGREGVTPYAYWAARWGLAPLWALALLVVGLGFWRRPAARSAGRA